MRLINDRFALPAVIKLTRYAPIPHSAVVLSRKNIYLRDNHTCQYCGKNGPLTIDHVMPKSRGGEDTWSNVVVSCVRCNNKKGDRTPEEIGMKLKTMPYRPASSLYLHMTRLNAIPTSWNNYFFRKREAVNN